MNAETTLPSYVLRRCELRDDAHVLCSNVRGIQSEWFRVTEVVANVRISENGVFAIEPLQFCCTSSFS
jgi:hypothetical protein